MQGKNRNISIFKILFLCENIKKSKKFTNKVKLLFFDNIVKITIIN